MALSSGINFDEILLTRIFRLFANLIELDFNDNSIESRPLISLSGLSPGTCYSSSLINLSISVRTFNDCLCLLDGRFPQLHKLCVLVTEINAPSLPIENLVRKYILIQKY